MARGPAGRPLAAVAPLLGAVLVLCPGAGAEPAHAAEDCEFAAPVVLPEPSYTRGNSNTIRWEHVPKSCWIGEDNSGKASTQRRFTVTIKNLSSGRTESVTVHGEDEVDATIDADELPRGPNGEVDGVRFEYVVVRKQKWCSSGSPALGTCQVTSTRTSLQSAAVRSSQDMTPPSGSLELADGATFARTRRVRARVTATDRAGVGGASSGAGWVEVSDAQQFGNCRRACVQSLDAPVYVDLPPGPDGIRTVHARVYDRARRAADDPDATAFGTPPGNVSQPFSDSVVLDTTPPTLLVRISTVRATVGVPVTFDASQSVDAGGRGADSGVEPSSGLWEFGDGRTGTALVTTHAYASPGTFPIALSVADRVGNVARVALGEITVVATPVPPQPQTTSTPPSSPPAPARVDRTAPSLASLSVRSRAATTTVAFRLSERATVHVEIRRLLPRPVRRMAALTRLLGAGRRGIVLPRAATRKPGRYLVVLFARDAAGNTSPTRSLRLTKRR